MLHQDLDESSNFKLYKRSRKWENSFLNGFEIWITYHKIHPPYVYNLIFRKLTELCNNHYNPILEPFHDPKQVPSAHLQLITTVSLCLIFSHSQKCLFIMEWNNIWPLCLTAFSSYNVCKTPVCVACVSTSFLFIPE